MNLSAYFVTPDGVDDAIVLAAVRGGATVVQLRDKSATDAAMIAQARRLQAALAPLGVPLIINDRLQVALESGAAGLHVGQSDGTPAQMRAALGPDRILGLSIETADQMQQIPPGTVDYIGAGPIFATATKPDHAAPMGMAGLQQIVQLASGPVVAIGGIGLSDVAALRATGAAGMAVVSAIAGAENPQAAAAALAQAWGASA